MKNEKKNVGAHFVLQQVYARIVLTRKKNKQWNYFLIPLWQKWKFFRSIWNKYHCFPSISLLRPFRWSHQFIEAKRVKKGATIEPKVSDNSIRSPVTCTYTCLSSSIFSLLMFFFFWTPILLDHLLVLFITFQGFISYLILSRSIRNEENVSELGLMWCNVHVTIEMVDFVEQVFWDGLVRRRFFFHIWRQKNFIWWREEWTLNNYTNENQSQ